MQVRVRHHDASMWRLLKRLVFLAVHVATRVWFFVENVVYCAINAFRERHRVPPVADRLLLTSATKLAQMIRNQEVRPLALCRAACLLHVVACR